MNPRTVILTAIPLEYNAVRGHITDVKEVTHPKGNVYEDGKFKGLYHNWDVGIAEVGAGNNTCALQTERAINFFKPEVVLFVGIAGGIKDLALGDVVAPEKAYGYEKGKITASGLLPRPEVGMSSYAIFERAKAEAKKNEWQERLPKQERRSDLKVITKPIAAGEKVLTEIRSEVYELIRSSYNDTVAIEMEGSGFYTACHANDGLQFLIVRGISDLLVNKSETDSAGYQDIAARNASAFAFEVLSKFKIK
ncbi:MAG: 5'-methylthioadenosine/S-adenosylhomocysteine nucleosidase [Bacteroidetes bacterium]|nr:5'-methylthioadenosine/S-adenosylhomocysteine nucleosidase [Bacteroidota bacterium]